MTACRRSEVSHATWNEFDLVERKWTIPGARMKNGQTAVIPLTDRMLSSDVLRPEIRTGDFVFSSGVRGDVAVSAWSKFKLKIDASITAELGSPLEI
jgi:integrase